MRNECKVSLFQSISRSGGNAPIFWSRSGIGIIDEREEARLLDSMVVCVKRSAILATCRNDGGETVILNKMLLYELIRTLINWSRLSKVDRNAVTVPTNIVSGQRRIARLAKRLLQY
jgi:hypothetical protein